MSVFTWKRIAGDTVMSPLDSLKHYKSFFRAGFMAMGPSSGHIKAYVGGPDYRYFQYDNGEYRKTADRFNNQTDSLHVGDAGGTGTLRSSVERATDVCFCRTGRPGRLAIPRINRKVRW